MQKLFYLLLALFVTSSLAAQFGVAATYGQPQVSYNDGGRENFLDGGLEFSANYWFRLQEKRVEFLPTVSFARYNYATDASTGSAPNDDRFQEIGFQFHTRIYPFDFGTDCDCPTFGKQAPALEKGFFIQVSPGVSLLQDQLSSTPSDQAATVSESAVLPTVGLALGLDFGLSNLVTITPMAGARYAIGDAPAALEPAILREQNNRYWKWFAGLHLAIRLDEKRY